MWVVKGAQTFLKNIYAAKKNLTMLGMGFKARSAHVALPGEYISASGNTGLCNSWWLDGILVQDGV